MVSLMSITSADELGGMQRVGRVVALALAAMRDAVRPGATPADIEAVGAEVLRQHGAQSAPVVVYQAPCAAFVSVKECVVHGLPTRTPLRAGDLVKIDAIKVAADRWTIATRDGGWTAHWEHTIVVTGSGAHILTSAEPAVVALH